MRIRVVGDDEHSVRDTFVGYKYHWDKLDYCMKNIFYYPKIELIPPLLVLVYPYKIKHAVYLNSFGQ